jgi:hypothetical protein
VQSQILYSLLILGGYSPHLKEVFVPKKELFVLWQGADTGKVSRQSNLVDHFSKNIIFFLFLLSMYVLEFSKFV